MAMQNGGSGATGFSGSRSPAVCGMHAVAVQAEQVRACRKVSTGRAGHLEPGCVVIVPLAAEASAGFICISGGRLQC